MPIDGCSGDSQGYGDLGGTFPVGIPGLGGCEGIGIHDCGAATGAALGAGCCEAAHGAFMDNVSLEFCKRRHHDEEEFSFSARTVGPVQDSGQYAQADFLLVEAIGDGKDFFH